MEKKLYSTDIANMSRFPRMNLINSLSGFKSVNLIGTIHTEALYAVIRKVGVCATLEKFTILPIKNCFF